MLRNAWKEVENTDDEEDFEDTIWYYFQSSGKAYENTKKTINGKTYIFDEDGRMLFGWINDKEASGDQYEMADKDEDGDGWKTAVYYAGEADDGAVVTSAWRQIRVYEEETPALKADDADTGDYDYWFYFGSNGKKYTLSTSDEAKGKDYTEKTIKGLKYGFAYDGHMVSEWTGEASDATIAKYFSDPENGALVKKGWFKVVPSVGIDETNSENQDNEAKWFYADSNGKLYKNDIKTVNGKKYLFNNQGEVLAGLRYIVYTVDEDGKNVIATDGNEKSIITNLSGDDTTKDDLDAYTTLDGAKVAEYFNGDGADRQAYIDGKTGVYYFAKPLDTDAAMKTGSVSLTIDGDSYSFKFKTDGTNKGKGINGRDGNYYYVNGRKVTADSDNKFEIYEATTLNNKVSVLYGEALTADDLIVGTSTDMESYGGDAFAVISTSGSIVKSGTKKDGDDYKITVKNYAVTGIKNSDDEEWEVDGTTVTYIGSKN